MKNFKVTYFRDAKEQSVFVYAVNRDEARNQFNVNYLGATILTIEES